MSIYASEVFPSQSDSDNNLLRKIATSLASVIKGSAGFLVRGAVTSTPAAAAYVDGSGAITSGGTAQQVFAANSGRAFFLFQNVSDIDMWINFGTAAVADQPSIKVAAGASFQPAVPSNQSVSVIGATTGKKFVAKQA